MQSCVLGLYLLLFLNSKWSLLCLSFSNSISEECLILIKSNQYHVGTNVNRVSMMTSNLCNLLLVNARPETQHDLHWTINDVSMLAVKRGKSHLSAKANFSPKGSALKHASKYKDEVIKFVEEYTYHLYFKCFEFMLIK